MIVVKVGQRGQITIPKAIRQQWDIGEGDQVAFVRDGDRIVLLPLTKTLLDLRGSVPVSAPQDFEAIRRQVIDQRAQEAATDES